MTKQSRVKAAEQAFKRAQEMFEWARSVESQDRAFARVEQAKQAWKAAQDAE